MRRYIFWKIVLMVMMISLLVACTQNSAEITSPTTASLTAAIETQTNYEESYTLWVLTDDDLIANSAWDEQVERIIETFEESSEFVTVELEVLPKKPDSRAAALERIRNQINQGKGPDVYLLPTFSPLEHLFNDANAAMRAGYFADIRNFYDMDLDLQTEKLNTVIMDAGTVGDCRYILPLRYDFPVAYVNAEAMQTLNLSSHIFSDGAVGMMDMLAWFEDAELAGHADIGMHQFGFHFFPDLLDYDNRSVLLSQDTVVDLLDSYIPFKQLASSATTVAYDDSYYHAWSNGEHWLQKEIPIHVESVSAALRNAAVAKAEGIALEMYPLTGADGSLVAEVSYYGAVGKDCPYPEAAYQFLRAFLTEESQWEQNITDIASLENSLGYGYCVRNTGSAGPIFQRHQTLLTGTVSAVHQEANSMIDVILTDADVPVLQAEIAIARFPLSDSRFQFARTLNEMIADSQAGTHETADYEAFAADFINQLGQNLP